MSPRSVVNRSRSRSDSSDTCDQPMPPKFSPWTMRKRRELRSEEHTSELQSRQYLVCRLLLEKKNKPSRVRCLIRKREQSDYDSPAANDLFSSHGRSAAPFALPIPQARYVRPKTHLLFTSRV